MSTFSMNISSAAELQQLFNRTLTLQRVDERTIRLVGEAETVGELVCCEKLPNLHFTSKQRQVLNLLVQGLSNRDIAQQLGISEKGVEYHVTNILRQVKLQTRGQLIWYLVRSGAIGLETLPSE